MNKKVVIAIISIIIDLVIVFAIISLFNTNTNTEGKNSNSIADTSNSNNVIEKRYLEGFEIAGNIRIPKTNLDIPVLSESTADSLNVSVAIMYGSGLNQVGNTVIMGHTYFHGENSGKFFTNNNQLSIGDIIYITDQYDVEIAYEIYEINKFKSSDVSYYERDTEGKKEITLVSSPDDKRLVIFAKEK
ncbi:MAG: sortase [Clostridia bacterium]|nr:sortase [Clostridia bacterium]